MNERYNEEDYETLRKAQFVYEERLRALKQRMDTLYIPDNIKALEPDLQHEIEIQRRNIFIALGIEENTDDEILY